LGEIINAAKKILISEIQEMTLVIIFDWTQRLLLQHYLLSPIAYVFLHIVFAVCLIPCSPMALIAGAIWGKWMGLCISILAALLSSCTTFCLSRKYLKKKIYTFLSKRYSKTDWFLTQTKQHGWMFVASVQLNPAAPASALGYLFGLTGIEFSQYALLTILFMIPLQIILVVVGDSFSQALIGQASWLFLGGFFVLIVAHFMHRIFFKRANSVIKVSEFTMNQSKGSRLKNE
jgi:uncharacterized membrane protein YdjX (TVP38/TMEM64 family)